MNRKKPSHQSASAASVVARIAQLPSLPMTEIKHLWRELFSAETPTHNRAFLERRIAYRLQEIECLKTTPEIILQNTQRIQKLLEDGGGKKQYSIKPVHRPPGGTVLIREHEGVEHRVTVTHDGRFEYRGQTFRSLSKVAHVITGTRWSGPRFFGLCK